VQACCALPLLNRDLLESSSSDYGGEIMSEPINTKGLKIKVFNFLNASALEREMQNWLDSLPVDSTIQNIEYGFWHGTGSIPLVSAFVLYKAIQSSPQDQPK
jgi:hypothetical protein